MSAGSGDGVAAGVTDRSAKGIAAAIGRMITAGDLGIGARLPTVRQLAGALDVSPTTVSEAWRTLADVGAIEARGRLGTFVAAPTGRHHARRFRRVSEGPGHFAIDLSTGTPDPGLLPDLAPVVARVGRQSLTSSYLDHPVLPELDEHLRGIWPFPAEELTVVDGAMDALDRVTAVAVRLGDRVVVEHPTFPPLLDLLELVGAEVLSVDVDAEGMVPEQLAAALAMRPSAVFLQPRAHNPTGTALSTRRATRLVAMLRGSEALVVEDDHSGDVGGRELVSLGRWLPERTVHIRSFSKSHGPDLRLAAVGGAADVVSTLANRRLLGPGWSSRILQAVLLELLRSAATAGVVIAAAEEYARRRQAVTAVLDQCGVGHAGGMGINLWMAVDDQRSALVRLAARGIGVSPGEPFLVHADAPHVRVTTGLIAGDVAAVARHLVEAAGAGSTRRRVPAR